MANPFRGSQINAFRYEPEPRLPLPPSEAGRVLGPSGGVPSRAGAARRRGTARLLDLPSPSLQQERNKRSNRMIRESRNRDLASLVPHPQNSLRTSGAFSGTTGQPPVVMADDALALDASGSAPLYGSPTTRKSQKPYRGKLGSPNPRIPLVSDPPPLAPPSSLPSGARRAEIQVPNTGNLPRESKPIRTGGGWHRGIKTQDGVFHPQTMILSKPPVREGASGEIVFDEASWRNSALPQDPAQISLKTPEPRGAEPPSPSNLHRPTAPVAQADPLRPRSAPNFIDRTDSWQHRPAGANEMFPQEETGRIPLNPQVDEEYLASLPSRSDQARGVMQPGSMGHTEPVEDDGYRFPGRGATPGARFDATRFRNRQEQIEHLDDRVADHAAASGGGYQGAGGVEVRPSGQLVTIDSDPSSPTYGKKSVQGTQLIGDAKAHEDSLARREARITGKTFIDRNTGKTTDYGKWQDYRAAKKEEEDQKRDVKQMRAQLRNYGRRGGATIDPSGGIAGPQHIGFQPRFDQNMSLNERTLLASQMLREDKNLADMVERKQRREDIESYTELSKTDPAGARQLYPDLFEDSVQKTPAERAATLERTSKFREMVRSNPQGIIDIMTDVRSQHESLAAANAELHEMGITQDIINSAMRRTEDGIVDEAYDSARDWGMGVAGGVGSVFGSMFGDPATGQRWARDAAGYFLEPTYNELDTDAAREALQNPSSPTRKKSSTYKTVPPGRW